MVQKVKRIDALGALMLASSVTLILIGLSKSSDDAISASPVPFLASGGFGLLLLLLIEKYQAKEPILPLQVLFARTPGAVALASWFISMTQFGISEFELPNFAHTLHFSLDSVGSEFLTSPPSGGPPGVYN